MADVLTAPVASFDQALGGRIAGVNVTSGEGMPGGNMSIVIRGNNSLTQENSPLFVIDGFPIEDSSAASTLNPSDIESLDFLKDASLRPFTVRAVPTVLSSSPPRKVR